MTRLILRIFLIIFLCRHTSFSQKLNYQSSEIIQPLHLISGEKDSILISDIFYSEDYNLRLIPNKNIDVEFSLQNKMLYLKPSEDFNGLGIIQFTTANNAVNGKNNSSYKFCIPFYSISKQTINFQLTPENIIGDVYLFGNFNNWDRHDLKMTDQNRDGIFEISIKLEPGKYEYKFFVDGKERLDPKNNEIKPNGLGGFNSIITVPPKNPGKNYLHILKREIKQDQIIFSFLYEGKDGIKSLNHSDIIALIDNQKVPKDKIKIVKQKIIINLNKENNYRILRLAVNRSGLTSNLQTVYLKKENSFNEMIIYSLLTDRFFNGDTSNDDPIIQDDLSFKANYQGGDFQGIIDKLKDGYFNSLGINTIWIFPLVDNPNKAYKEYPPPHRYYTGYHGYWPISFTRIEEHFGDLNLFKELVKTAHQHKIKILLDFVSHHIHIENPFWKEHRDWFGELKLPDGRMNLRLWDEHRLTTWFEPYMPSFNYRNSNALDTMTDNAVWWIKQTGIDGFRHDAVKHVPNVFWRTLTNKIKKEIEIPLDKNIYQIGETFGSYRLISSYVNNGQLDAQFNFNLYNTALPVFLNDSASFELLDNELHKTFSVYGVNNLMGNIMDSHDKVRFMSYADDDISLTANDAAQIGWVNPPKVESESSYKKAQLYLCYLLTIPGIPIIYYGDEIGMSGAADPDNRRKMRFGSQLSPGEKDNLKIVKKLISIRQNSSALNYGDFITIEADNNCYVYLRSDFEQRIIIALNKSDNLRSISLGLPEFYKVKKAVNLIDKNSFEVKDNKISFNISPVGFIILKLE